MLTYDGTNMQMLSQAPTAAGSGSVSSLFGRTGIVAAAAGDYTTAQVTESGNLYFTPARALAAVTWSTLTGKPSTYAPSAHAASHQAGGSDEIATATPAANAIPKAGASGKLAGDWLPSPAASSLGGVRAIDCSGTGYVQKINADGSVSCAAPAGGGGSIKTAIVFDGATGTLADGSSVSWSCGSGSAAQCTAVWTVPDGVTWVRSVVWSGGGGGNGSVVASRSNAGGGGGGYADVMCPVTPGSTVSVAVGLGGAGGTAGGGAGGAGGDSRFASCVTVKGAPVYTSSVNNAPVGGGIAGSPQIWLNAAGTGLLTWSASSTPCAFGGTVATGQVLRMDQGGCGATGLSSTNGPGHDGGSAIGGGGGGGNGAYNSDTYGNGGTSTLGGAGGRGGAHTAATGLTPCAAGAVPGGGGGSAAAAASGSSYAGCAGARGEIRIYY
jgi:hypothetical protein